MKSIRTCGIGTRVLVYALVISVTLLYMPVAELSMAHAAKSKPSVYVFSFTPDGDKTPLALLGMTETQLKSGFKKESRITYISPKQARAKLKTSKKRKPATKGIEGDAKYAKRVAKYVDRAKEAYTDEDFDGMMKYASRAVKYAKRSPNHLDGFDIVKDAYTYLAAAEVETEGDPNPALLNVLAFDPDFSPKGELRYSLKRALRQAKKASRSGSLAIKADPKDAKILVNGKSYTGQADLGSLYAGSYFVRVEAAGFETYDNVVKIDRGSESLEVVLGSKGGQAPAEDDGVDKMAVYKNLNKKARKGDFDEKWYRDAAKFGKWIKADYLVLAGFQSRKRSSRLYPVVFNVRSGEMGEIEPVRMGNDLDDAEDKMGVAFADTRDAILGDFPEETLAPGFIFGAAAVAAAPAPAPEPVYEPEPEPEPEPELFVAPVTPVSETLDLDVDDSIYFSEEDETMGQEDAEGEESFEPVEKTPFYKQWWFWTAIGVVVVGGAVGTAIALQPEDKDRPSRLELP